MQFEFSQKLHHTRQVPASTANNKVTSGRLLLSSTIALDHHNIFYRYLKIKTKLLALIYYSKLAIRQLVWAESVWYLAHNCHLHCHHGHCGAISIKLPKWKSRQQSTLMKLARMTLTKICLGGLTLLLVVLRDMGSFITAKNNQQKYISRSIIISLLMKRTNNKDIKWRIHASTAVAAPSSSSRDFQNQMDDIADGSFL
jgi:hypothetical protein